MDAMIETKPARGLAPFSLKDAPALIERVFPAQKVGIEAQKERKAVQGQTLTALGSYWKGRKPLVLVRACVLASLLPATDDAEGDLELFEALMRMDPEGISRRFAKVTAPQVENCPLVPNDTKARQLVFGSGTDGPPLATWRRFEAAGDMDDAERDAARRGFDDERDAVRQLTLGSMPFSLQVSICERVEGVEDIRNGADPLYAGVLDRANTRLGTTACTLPELVQQLGVARFGRHPIVGDPFAGGGSIPFEAARLGCDVVAGDLNPVAAMLTWGALNIIGADRTKRDEIAAAQAAVAAAVEAEILRLGIEHNARGDRSKVYFYCLETVDPRTGWRVPMSPSWLISRSRQCVAKLVPVPARKCFEIVIIEGASSEDMKAAEIGTIRDGHLVYRMVALPEAEEHRIPIARLRGDGEGSEVPGGRRNRLRRWDPKDIGPREPVWVADAQPVIAASEPGAWTGGDIWLERLYCIQWIDGADLAIGKSRPRTFFEAPGPADADREATVRRIVDDNILAWQAAGLVPDMPIETGEKTEEPIRTRGWTHWHHLFGPRHLLFGALAMGAIRSVREPAAPTIAFADALNRMSRLTRWDTGLPGKAGGARDGAKDVFYNQALNCNYSYAQRSAFSLVPFMRDKVASQPLAIGTATLEAGPCAQGTASANIWIYDPPYADAVYYHEITEYFIAWLRKNPPAPFDQWTWDSRRPLAIKGKDEKFRSDMTDAFRAMRKRMPDNGLQVCMFTHQDAGVWADMAGIVWGAGLRVTAAWYVSTETTSELKKGGYVQGTVLLVLRKRQGDERTYKDELVVQVRDAVARQVTLLTGMNQNAKARQRDENLFSDADIQMAGYAAALEVLTGYTHVEGVDMTREALRPRVKGQKGIVEEMIDLAVQTAVEMMRPDGLDTSLWEKLAPTERFWLKMTEAEATAPVGTVGGKVDAYQNFAKAYRADGWEDLMADRNANRARLKSAVEFKRAMMSGHPFSAGPVRPVLFAIADLQGASEREEDHGAAADRALAGLRDNLAPWAQRRHQALAVADWLGRTVERIRPGEASAARTLAALIRSERLG